METPAIKQFAQWARRNLMDAVGAQLDHVLEADNPEFKENKQAIRQLNRQIEQTSRQDVIERTAYTWFNRFCALRFMDVNRYTPIGIVSPLPGHTHPEILEEAGKDFIPQEITAFLDVVRVRDIICGRVSSSRPQQEVYRMLLTASCNYYHNLMPFLFQPIKDYTHLLLPGDLLSPGSFPEQLRNVLTPEVCRDVEVIGWLYQYYNSEKKEQISAAVKEKNLKITAQYLPAATQIFTPHWIVKYLVQNTLGRLWLLNNPQSGLKEKMEYYIPPAEPVDDYLEINSPEEITICDPACGSGHMLVYAFDLLYEIYEECGYDEIEIPALILEKNLYGIEIDERAGELAAFALAMKARNKNRRFLNKSFQVNICILENLRFDRKNLEEYMAKIGPELSSPRFQTEIQRWTRASTFGALMQPRLPDAESLGNTLEKRWRDNSSDIFLADTHKSVHRFLKQVSYLQSKYDIIITNPPYLGIKKMGGLLRQFAIQFYPDNKFDLFRMFIRKGFTMCESRGFLGFMTPFTWMFLSSCKTLREHIIDSKTITTLAQLSSSGFSGAAVRLCIFTMENALRPQSRGAYIDLGSFQGSAIQPVKTREAIRNPDCGWIYRISAQSFSDFPGSPFAISASSAVRKIFNRFSQLADYADAKAGITTGDNDRFLRQWFESAFNNIGFDYTQEDRDKTISHRWLPYNKGGENRKWYGSKEYVINWYGNGAEIKASGKSGRNNEKPSCRILNLEYMLRECITWTQISFDFRGRYVESGTMFDNKGCSFFPKKDLLYCLLGFLNTNVSSKLLSIINPTVSILTGSVSQLPVVFNRKIKKTAKKIATQAIEIAKNDWNAFETSWDFTALPLLHRSFRRETFQDTYKALACYWDAQTAKLKQLEEENNRLFIETYGLQEELPPEIPLKEITLTCNPHYRYGNHKTPEKLERLRLTDTVKEFISYAVGCMFGRYSLDKPCLILANKGESLTDFLKKVPFVTFTPDDDNVIPIVEGDWFTDNITQRFLKFLKITFGGDCFQENLAFIEGVLEKTVERYFLKDFYTDHVKRYKKRPIYWLFSSPRGSFNALIYMHRYRPDTVSIILNDYLREYRSKLSARLRHLDEMGTVPAAGGRNRFLKEKTALHKTIEELDNWEQDVLYPLATQNIALDLDDGVKTNYKKFGKALKPI